MYNDEVTSDIQYLVTSIVDVNKQRRRVFVNYEPAFVLYNSEYKKDIRLKWTVLLCPIFTMR